MEEKGKNITTENLSIKLEWEAPQLISLDKKKTESGTSSATEEGIIYYPTIS